MSAPIGFDLTARHDQMRLAFHIGVIFFRWLFQKASTPLSCIGAGLVPLQFFEVLGPYLSCVPENWITVLVHIEETA